MIMIKDSVCNTWYPYRRCCRKGKRGKSNYDYLCRRMRKDCGNLWFWYLKQPTSKDDQKLIDGLVDAVISTVLLKTLMVGD